MTDEHPIQPADIATATAALPSAPIRDEARHPLDYSRVSRVHTIAWGKDVSAKPEQLPTPAASTALQQRRESILGPGGETFLQNLSTVRVQTSAQTRRALQQAGVTRQDLMSHAAATAPSNGTPGSDWQWNDPMRLPTESRQINLEDLYSMYDFVELRIPGTTIDIIERVVYDENYLAGGILDRIVSATFANGIQIGTYKIDIDPTELVDAADLLKPAFDPMEEAANRAEAQTIETWMANAHRAHSLRWILGQLVISRRSLGNAYCEVLADQVGPNRRPAGLEPAITSTMRVMRGHRGYIQWTGGLERWFNLYMPRIEDRIAGVQLWSEWWASNGVDVNNPAFIASPLSRMLSSRMPAGTWNPYLTEMVHLKGNWPRSKYYGFPTDYRLGLLWALLEYALQYNVNLMRNNRMQPFVLLWHGPLDDTTAQDIESRFANVAGPGNYGRTLLLECEAGAGSMGQPAPKMGLEILKLAPDTDGLFMPLWEKVERSHAKHYKIPWDLLDTNNSNKASAATALDQLALFVTNDAQEEIETELLEPITREDLGLTRRFISLPRVRGIDEQAQAQVHDLYVKNGTLNNDEVREDLGRDPRPGGDQFKDITGAGVTMEDEVSEEEAAKAAAEYARSGKAATTAAGGESGDPSKADDGTGDS